MAFIFSVSYMGCHPSHWRTPSFVRGVGRKTTNQNRLQRRSGHFSGWKTRGNKIQKTSRHMLKHLNRPTSDWNHGIFLVNLWLVMVNHWNNNTSDFTDWWFGTWLLWLSRNSWKWNDHPNWRTPSFVRGVGLNHQPDMFWTWRTRLLHSLVYFLFTLFSLLHSETPGALLGALFGAPSSKEELQRQTTWLLGDVMGQQWR